MTGTEPQLALRRDDLIWQVVDGEVVVLDFPAGTYFATNRAGTVLWERLRAGTTRDALVAELHERYGITAQQAGTEVDEFVGQLSANGLLA